MISFEMTTPSEMLQKIAARARTKRLALNLSQHTLSQKSGVSYGVLKQFERTGRISLSSLLKLAMALGALSEFETLFTPPPPHTVLSLDELLPKPIRKRGRK